MFFCLIKVKKYKISIFSKTSINEFLSKESLMKATGIVRRIDDLGRVVIPKEIRRTLRIREGDPLEIYTDSQGEVILKKYSMVGELSNFAQEYVDSLSLSAKVTSVICDRENIVAASSGDKKELMDKRISKELDRVISKRQLVTSLNGDYDIISDKKNEHVYEVISPIVANGDPIGAIVLLSKDKHALPIEQGSLLAKTGSIFLAKQLEQ
ncbi:putative stage V sporulation protein T [Anaerofustis stercorihominis DSM 17244]|uniref:Stage V sporulation protein T n=2 Tax=Anaerofustis stercorihominis TaxID=214853 RepID=B1C8Y4_9FIRM|nr:putative stage V sporulation protein T [Anaerofustis stercorihominis DSM 17244]